MPKEQRTSQETAERLRTALESSDLDAFHELLDPHVRWGAPDDPAPSCQNRDQVLAWYQRRRDDCIHASVTEVAIAADKVLVGLKVRGSAAAEGHGGEVDRWQVLTLSRGRVVDIRGFDDRREAAARAGVG